MGGCGELGAWVLLRRCEVFLVVLPAAFCFFFLTTLLLDLSEGRRNGNAFCECF